MSRDLVYDDVLQRDESFFIWHCGAKESTVQQTPRHQFFYCQGPLVVWNIPKPSFVLVRLVDDAPEDVIELPHTFCTSTFADVADQCCTSELRSDMFL